MAIAFIHWPMVTLIWFLGLASMMGRSLASNVTTNVTVDVCPEAVWKKVPFIKEPDHVPAMFFNVKNLTYGDDIEPYIRDELLPSIEFALAFVGLAVVLLVAYLIWRVLRACCLCCCCAQSCKEDREKNEPVQVLSSGCMWSVKIIMLIFGLAGICLTIYGMTAIDKELVQKGWDTTETIVDYADTLAASMDHLLAEVNTTLPLVDEIESITVNDVELAKFRTKLAVVGSFLDNSVINPVALRSQLQAVSTDLATLSAQLAAHAASVTSMQTSLPSLQSAASTVSASSSLLSGIKSSLTSLDNALGNVGASEPAAQASDSSITNLNSAISATPVASWISSLDALNSALDTMEGYRTSNPYPAAITALDTLQSTINQLKATDIPALTATLTGLSAAYTGASPSINWVLAKLTTTVNTTVIQLDASMQAAYNRLNRMNLELSALMNTSPTPTELSGNLTQLAAALVMPADTPTLRSSLVTASSQLSGMVAVASFKSYASSLRSSLASLQPLLSNTNTALQAYISAPGSSAYSTLYNSVAPAGKSKSVTDTALAAASPASAASDVSSLQSTGSAIAPAAAAGAATLVAQLAAVTSMQAAVMAYSPAGAFSKYIALCDALAVDYNALPTPKSDVLNSMYSALLTLESATLTEGENVRSEVQDINDQFGSSPGRIRNDFTGKVHEVRDKWYDKSGTIGTIRYDVTMGVYGLCILMVLLLFIFALVNCPFGAALATFLLIVTVLLYWLIAALLAAGMTVTNDACYSAETVAISLVEDKYKGMVRYYVYGTGGTIRTVLNDTGILDVSDVEAQVTDARYSISAAISSKYTVVGKMKISLGKVNTTLDSTMAALDAMLQQASYGPVNAVYTSVKGYLCCDVPNEMSRMWTVLTFAGWVCWVLSILAMIYLGRLDKLPMAGCCCSCSCLLPSRYTQRVYPNGSDTVNTTKAVQLQPPLQQPAMTYAPGSYTPGMTPVLIPATPMAATPVPVAYYQQPAQSPAYYPVIPH